MTESDEGFKGRGGFYGYDHAGREEFYVYSADSGQLRCASCIPSGAPATTDPRLEILVENQPIQKSSHLSHALSDDGRYVFFSTAERLVPSDTNGTWDAYVFDTTTEEHRLLSSGEDQSPSYLMDASADGSDAFIATAEPLSRWDNDTGYDLYDARVDGGLPEPVPAPPSCQGDACQPTPRQLNDPPRLLQLPGRTQLDQLTLPTGQAQGQSKGRQEPLCQKTQAAQASSQEQPEGRPMSIVKTAELQARRLARALLATCLLIFGVANASAAVRWQLWPPPFGHDAAGP